MSQAELPKTVDAFKLADQKLLVQGHVPLAGLRRFGESPVVRSVTGYCEVELQFGRDPERRRVVDGVLSADIELECQRCMEAMPFRLESSPHLGLVISEEQARQLPRDLEPFLTDEAEADLWQLVEDELLLALPSFPLHDPEECPATATINAINEAEDAKYESDDSSQKAENPFSVLAELKNKQ